MTPEMIEEGVVCLGIFGAFLLILAAGCLIADFVFPHIRPLERYLEGLPEDEDDEEIARRYEIINWKRVARQYKKMLRKSTVRQRKRIRAMMRKFF